jgi:hypothetical protein
LVPTVQWWGGPADDFADGRDTEPAFAFGIGEADDEVLSHVFSSRAR